MIKTFTPNDLIRFLYHETSEEESREISKALECDAELQLQFTDLQDLSHRLTDAEESPSATAVLNIMSYARSRQPKPH
jgi:hypothetical protein